MLEATTAEQYLIQASESFNQRDYEGAIVLFRKSLALEEHWYSYQCLGWSLSRERQYSEAIDIFHKSIKLQEHWNSYQGLGWALFNSMQYGQAIDIFHKSIKLQEHWNSYQGLGWALFYTNKHLAAIDTLNKSLALKKDSNTYKGIGESLMALDKHKEAIAVFKRLAIEDDSSFKTIDKLIKPLSKVFSKKGDQEKAIRTMEIGYTYDLSNYPIKKIDLFCGAKDSKVDVSSQELDSLQNACKTLDYDFYPSFVSSNIDPSLESWRYLMYLHIPKCAGTSIQFPIKEVLKQLTYFMLNQPKAKGNSTYLNYRILDNNAPATSYSIDGFERILKQAIMINKNKVDSIFHSPHGESWKQVNESIDKINNTTIRIFTTVRDPRKRLYSQIRMLGHSISIESTERVIKHYQYYYDNCIDRFIYDYGLLGSQHQEAYCEPTDYEEIKNIEFVDVGDSSTIKRIKTSYLSAASMPNIIQPTRIGTAIDREQKLQSKMSDDEIKSIYNKCLEKGFIDRDMLIDLEFLKKKTLNRIKFPQILHNCSSLHPITMLCSSNLETKLIATSDFIKDPEKWLIT